MRPIVDLAALVAADAHLVHRGRHLATTFLLEVGDEPWLVVIDAGTVASVQGGRIVMPTWRFALRAPAEEWAAFWSPHPPPGSHDLFAMLKRGVLRAEGDLHPFMANLRYFKDLIATLRDPQP